MQEFTNMRPNVQLKRERELHGWTQQNVAERLGVPLVAVRDWEDGFMAPNSDCRERLCVLYQKDAEALGLNEEMYSAEELSIPSQNSAALPMIEGEKLRLKDRRRRGNLFNIGIIVLVLAVILLPSLWFLIAKAQSPKNPVGNATPPPQFTSTTRLHPTYSHNTPSPGQKSKTTLPGMPPGVNTTSTSGPVTVTSTIPGGSPPPTGLGTPTPTSGLPGYPGLTPTGNSLSPTTGPGTATPTPLPTTAPTPTPTATPCIIPTETIGVAITVTDDMQDPNGPCYNAPTGTHRADWARGPANPAHFFIANQPINGDNTFVERTYASSGPNVPYIVWRCSNITTFTAITYFSNSSPNDPDFNFYYSTDPMAAPGILPTQIPGANISISRVSIGSSGWTSRTYTLNILPTGVNDIEMGWSTAATTTTNTTPLIGQVMMTCTGGY